MSARDSGADGSAVLKTDVPLMLGDRIPHVCKVSDVCRILRISRRTFERLTAQRKLPLAELDRIDRHRRFSGASVQRIAAGRWAR